jgi:hypothetical protein
LIRFARARVGYKAPEDIVVLDDMPLNATGKVDPETHGPGAEGRLTGSRGRGDALALGGRPYGTCGIFPPAALSSWALG